MCLDANEPAWALAGAGHAAAAGNSGRLVVATPELSKPPELVLTEVKGSMPSTRPWVRYELANPALERLASGQKILLRVGPEQGQALRAKLASLRSALAAAPR